tara:strand:- start:7812 stop:9017 length:1206 start_codon:yes stop_codon:yes gene_type:complete
MADPVAQILEQAQNVSGGAPFGDFFVRGVQSAQQDRQLDQADRGLNLEEELNTARIQDLGAKAVAGRAAQKLKLNQQLLSGPTAKKVQDWINRKSPMVELGDVVAALSNLNEDDPVREFGMKHVSMVSAAEDATAKRAAIRKEKVDAFPTPEQQTEAKKNIIGLLGPNAKISVNADGGLSGTDPTGRTVTTRFDPETGVFERVEATGSAVGAGSIGDVGIGGTTADQKAIADSELIRSQITQLEGLITPETVGPRGQVKHLFTNKIKGPLRELLGGKANINKEIIEVRNLTTQLQSKVFSQLKIDSQMNTREFDLVRPALPDISVWETSEEFQVKLKALKDIATLSEYQKRRNNPNIPMQPFLDRLSQPQVIDFIAQGRRIGMLSDVEARSLAIQSGVVQE